MRSAIVLLAACALQLLAQSTSIAPEPAKGHRVLHPYTARTVPPARTADQQRPSDLIRAGTLYLTAQDAIALALENNIDIEIARYNPLISEWQLTRAQAGGPLPGIPSNASQAGAVASGQGVAGSQSAAGVATGQNGGGGGQTANATISQVGPATQTLDPAFQSAATFSHTSNPQANSTQSLTTNLISNTRAYTDAVKDGFLSGGNATLTYTDHYLKENAPTDLLNPSVAPNLSFSIQHNLLNGFGIATNARNITVAAIGIQTANLNFRNTVSNITAQVLDAYYRLAEDQRALEAARKAVDVARDFEGVVKIQIDNGTAAPPDLVAARSQTALAEGTVADADAAVKNDELRLKSMISRSGIADPAFAAARITPLDRIVIPAQPTSEEDTATVEDLVRTAVANRPDIAIDHNEEQSSETSALGTRNGLLPTLQVLGGTSQVGLAGDPRPPIPFGSAADPYFVGNIGTALGQVFRRNFYNLNGGAVFVTQIGNHQAQADFAIDQLQLRQTQLSTRKDLAQVEVDVMNSVIALRQARAQYEAATHNRVLQEQLLTGERTKFDLGASTPFNVTQQQRDLISGQSQELSAEVAYESARIALDLTLGTILQANHVSIAGEDVTVPAPK
jgi:outer membrane protein TolC